MRIILSERAYARHFRELEQLGYMPISLARLPKLNAIVADHADTLIFECGELLSAVRLDGFEHILANDKPFGNYPNDIKLNALALGGCLFGKLDSLSPELLQLANRHGLRPVFVKQGYTRCSVLVLDPCSAITSDLSLGAAMREHRIEVMQINPGYIHLDGCQYGFIGGASAVDLANRRAIFFGRLGRHPDGEHIRDFCRSKSFEPIELDGELTDFGGAIIRK